MREENVLDLDLVEFEVTEGLQDRDVNGQSSEPCESIKSSREVWWGRQGEGGLRLDPW